MVKGINRSLLLIDDDEDDVLLFKETLLSICPEVELVVFNNGRLVIDALHKASRLPTIILMELYIPLKNGFECLLEIKNSKNLHAPYIFIFSDSTYTADIERAYKYGADLFIRKPTSLQEMNEIVTFLNGIDLTAFKKPELSHFVFPDNYNTLNLLR